jgi:hypothetical protein
MRSPACRLALGQLLAVSRFLACTVQERKVKFDISLVRSDPTRWEQRCCKDGAGIEA